MIEVRIFIEDTVNRPDYSTFYGFLEKGVLRSMTGQEVSLCLDGTLLSQLCKSNVHYKAELSYRDNHNTQRNPADAFVVELYQLVPTKNPFKAIFGKPSFALVYDYTKKETKK